MGAEENEIYAGKEAEVIDYPGSSESDIEQPTRLEILLDQDLVFLEQKARKAVDRIKKYESKRSALNEQIAAIRSDLESLGIPKKTLALALSVSKMTDEQLDGFWLALQVMLKAVDRPISKQEIQMDLFADL